MLNLKDITIEIQRLGDLRDLVETYKLIASSMMQKIRNSVLQNRAFHAGLNQIFQEVKRAHKKELKELARQRKKRKQAASVADAARKQARLFILLSANTGLFGDIVAKTFGYFREELKKSSVDIAVVGKIGRSLMGEFLPEKKFIYFDFPDDRMDIQALAQVTSFSSQYDEVFAFYGRFRSFLTQEVIFSNISGSEDAADSADKPEAKYLFEPSLEIVVVFFEKEIFASLLEQVFSESRLAKLASRMMLLERSTQEIEATQRRANLERQRIRHEFLNKKQLNAMAGVALWGNG